MVWTRDSVRRVTVVRAETGISLEAGCTNGQADASLAQGKHADCGSHWYQKRAEGRSQRGVSLRQRAKVQKVLYAAISPANGHQLWTLRTLITLLSMRLATFH